MSFGMYRPTMGVAGGHRELVSNKSLHEQRKMGEHMRRQDINPITGEPVGDPVSSGSSKPQGNLGAGLVPTSGPLDNVLLTGKDMPSKRADPTKNQSHSFHSGVSCLAHEAPQLPPAQPSRITESCFGEGLCERESSSRDSRRGTPGQVVRSGIRPKDNLSGGCVTSDQIPDHPLNLPRKAGSASAAVGSGGSCHIFQGPNGFVPLGPENFDMTEQPLPRRSAGASAQPFQRACGAAAVMAS